MDEVNNIYTHKNDVNVEVAHRLADINQRDWDTCAGTSNPFLCHDFLSSLEDSGSVSATCGWAPHHFIIRDKGDILACAPHYLKGHSHGEYVFDWMWAESFQRAGGNYYPKSVMAVPFTPVTGPRLLVRNDLPPSQKKSLKARLVQASIKLARQNGFSSIHANFITNDDLDAFKNEGFLHRTGIQYHWQNNGYTTYTDFLDALTSRKRKALKKERRTVLQNDGIKIERLSGDEIGPQHWDAMYSFYQNTGAKKWGMPYLNREFFHLLGDRMASRILLIMAKDQGQYIAGALNMIGDNALYGRYWGCSKDIRYLHFELCYHQAIEAAIERGLERVEAGAQGEHKIARGYLPIITQSAHYIFHDGFQDAIKNFLVHERKAIVNERNALFKENPFRDVQNMR